MHGGGTPCVIYFQVDLGDRVKSYYHGEPPDPTGMFSRLFLHMLSQKNYVFAAWIAEGCDSCYAKHPLWGQVVLAAARMCHHCLAFSL